MSHRKLRVIASLGTFALLATTARANPVVVDWEPPGAITIGLLAIAFACEILVTLKLLSIPSQKRWRTGVTFAMIQIPTFLGLVVSYSRTVRSLGEGPGIALIECSIVVAEALMYFMFLRASQERRSLPRCVAASVVGNVASISVGVLGVFVLVKVFG